MDQDVNKNVHFIWIGINVDPACMASILTRHGPASVLSDYTRTPITQRHQLHTDYCPHH